MIAIGVDTHAAGQRVLVSELLPGELDGPVDPACAEHIVCAFDTSEVPFPITGHLFDALRQERKALGRMLDTNDVLRVAGAKDGHDVDG